MPMVPTAGGWRLPAQCPHCGKGQVTGSAVISFAPREDRQLRVMDGTDWSYSYVTDTVKIEGREYVPVTRLEDLKKQLAEYREAANEAYAFRYGITYDELRSRVAAMRGDGEPLTHTEVMERLRQHINSGGTTA